MFFVPKSDRSFTIANSDFQFLQLEGTQTTAIVPTAIGNDDTYYLVGDLDGQQVRLKTPKGVNQETINYPYLDVSLALPSGTELTGRFSTKNNFLHLYFPGAAFFAGAIFMLISSIIAYIVLKNDPIVHPEEPKA
jgi:hypothetical protein